MSVGGLSLERWTSVLLAPTEGGASRWLLLLTASNDASLTGVRPDICEWRTAAPIGLNRLMSSTTAGSALRLDEEDVVPVPLDVGVPDSSRMGEGTSTWLST